MNTLTLLGVVSLVVSCGLIVALYMLFLGMGNGRYRHFRRFFLLQAVAYIAASLSVPLDNALLLVAARVLTPISYAFLFFGLTRVRDETL